MHRAELASTFGQRWFVGTAGFEPANLRLPKPARCQTAPHPEAAAVVGPARQAPGFEGSCVPFRPAAAGPAGVGQLSHN